MSHQFSSGDDLIFQLESGFGLLRVIAVEETDSGTVWHLMAYEELFPSVEAAENALSEPLALHVRKAHIALTNRAFERTPAARLGNRPVTEEERAAYQQWIEDGGRVSDRSALLMLGLREMGSPHKKHEVSKNLSDKEGGLAPALSFPVSLPDSGR